MSDSAPRIVIVGGGFGGLAAAKALKNTPAQVVLIDRSNHHLFQPLLYQVATNGMVRRLHTRAVGAWKINEGGIP